MTLPKRLSGATARGCEVTDFLKPVLPAPCADQSQQRVQAGGTQRSDRNGHYICHHGNETFIEARLFPTVKLGYCAMRHHGFENTGESARTSAFNFVACGWWSGRLGSAPGDAAGGQPTRMPSWLRRPAPL